MQKKVRKGGMRIRMEDEVRILEWARIGGLGRGKNTRSVSRKLLLVRGRSKVGPGGGAYLRLRYCSDFISLEKPLRVSIWLSRRCKLVRLLRYSKPSTFFNMFCAYTPGYSRYIGRREKGKEGRKKSQKEMQPGWCGSMD